MEHILYILYTVLNSTTQFRENPRKQRQRTKYLKGIEGKIRFQTNSVFSCLKIKLNQNNLNLKDCSPFHLFFCITLSNKYAFRICIAHPYFSCKYLKGYLRSSEP